MPPSYGVTNLRVIGMDFFFSLCEKRNVNYQLLIRMTLVQVAALLLTEKPRLPSECGMKPEWS